MYVCCYRSLHVQCNTPRPTLHAQCSTARITMQRATNMQDCTCKYTSENASSLYRCMHKASFMHTKSNVCLFFAFGQLYFFLLILVMSPTYS